MEGNGQAPRPWRMGDRAATTARPQCFLWAPGSPSRIVLRRTIRDERGKCPYVADGAPESQSSLLVSGAPSPGPQGFQNKTTHASSGPVPVSPRCHLKAPWARCPLGAGAPRPDKQVQPSRHVCKARRV